MVNRFYVGSSVCIVPGAFRHSSGLPRNGQCDGSVDQSSFGSVPGNLILPRRLLGTLCLFALKVEGQLIEKAVAKVSASLRKDLDVGSWANGS